MFKRVTAILPLDEETAERDADALLRTVIAVATNGKTAAVRELRDIAGHVWMGRLSAARAAGSVEGTSGQRTKDESLRARVFVRDGFRCTQCGGRAVPRSILVAIHDLYPEEIPYDVHYTRGRTHPAFWAPVPEADHVLAHSRGGFNDLANLATLHAACNTRKSDSPATYSAHNGQNSSGDDWDGLTSFYPALIEAGAGEIRPRYHREWSRRYAILMGQSTPTHDR